MTMTPVRSAYPASIEALMPQARALAEAEGLPSQNKLKEALRVGRPKARDIRDALEAEGFQTQSAKPEPTDIDATATAAAVDPDKAEMFAKMALDLAADYPDSTLAREAVNRWVTAEPTRPDPVSGTRHDTVEVPAAPAVDEDDTTVVPQEKPVADPPSTTAEPEPEAEAGGVASKPIAVWPVLLLLLPATVAIWSGWVGLGSLAGFGPVHPLPGIVDSFVIDTSITLPIGMETYSAYALYVWLSGRASAKAIRFARISALIALGTGAAGQIAYHLMTAAGVPQANPLITAAVACIPVAVLGLGAALAHLVKNSNH